jgi:hypothetical protein
VGTGIEGEKSPSLPPNLHAVVSMVRYTLTQEAKYFVKMTKHSKHGRLAGHKFCLVAKEYEISYV